ncbi:hypothetical protein C7M84_006992 [Penaeus vannamei]|uniref:Uncharacterized protein n=1 Tax=Penaeus vannamei TaxID=6689 RepID=A0A3R7M6Q6_PENVA|nr:hypothetical protein C7M84_006992 [Penaeus vannamei]
MIELDGGRRQTGTQEWEKIGGVGPRSFTETRPRSAPGEEGHAPATPTSGRSAKRGRSERCASRPDAAPGQGDWGGLCLRPFRSGFPVLGDCRSGRVVLLWLGRVKIKAEGYHSLSHSFLSAPFPDFFCLSISPASSPPTPYFSPFLSFPNFLYFPIHSPKISPLLLLSSPTSPLPHPTPISSRKSRVLLAAPLSCLFPSLPPSLPSLVFLSSLPFPVPLSPRGPSLPLPPPLSRVRAGGCLAGGCPPFFLSPPSSSPASSLLPPLSSLPSSLLSPSSRAPEPSLPSFPPLSGLALPLPPRLLYPLPGPVARFSPSPFPSPPSRLLPFLSTSLASSLPSPLSRLLPPSYPLLFCSASSSSTPLSASSLLPPLSPLHPFLPIASLRLASSSPLFSRPLPFLPRATRLFPSFPPSLRLFPIPSPLSHLFLPSPLSHPHSLPSPLSRLFPSFPPLSPLPSFLSRLSFPSPPSLYRLPFLPLSRLFPSFPLSHLFLSFPPLSLSSLPSPSLTSSLPSPLSHLFPFLPLFPLPPLLFPSFPPSLALPFLPPSLTSSPPPLSIPPPSPIPSRCPTPDH